jgi:hypothetical protein
LQVSVAGTFVIGPGFLGTVISWISSSVSRFTASVQATSAAAAVMHAAAIMYFRMFFIVFAF